MAYQYPQRQRPQRTVWKGGEGICWGTAARTEGPDAGGLPGGRAPRAGETVGRGGPRGYAATDWEASGRSPREADGGITVEDPCLQNQCAEKGRGRKGAPQGKPFYPASVSAPEGRLPVTPARWSLPAGPADSTGDFVFQDPQA